jgi:hypothetical protein
MTDETQTQARPFDSYTSADHARVAMAQDAWYAMAAAYAALVPELRRDPRPTALIEAAVEAHGAAVDLLRAAVVASHEQGLSWSQIGLGLGVTKQSAHERFAQDVGEFRRALADHLNALSDDPRAELPAAAPVYDTAKVAPRIDRYRVELGEVPGTMSVAGRPGELLAQLSDPATAVTGVNGTSARPVDAPVPRCRFSADAAWQEGSEPGEYLACTAAEGHPGRHQLAVSNSYYS